MKGEIYMFKKVVNGSIVSIASLVAMLILSVALVSAKANTIKTYYKFACSTTSKEHSADNTPNVKITTSDMTGDDNDTLWVEIDKKYWYGWAGPGSKNFYTQVSSVDGSTFSLKGNKSGTYQILFGKTSMLLSGKYDKNSKKWYSKLKIVYNH